MLQLRLSQYKEEWRTFYEAKNSFASKKRNKIGVIEWNRRNAQLISSSF